MVGSLSISGTAILDSHSFSPCLSLRSEGFNKLVTTHNMYQNTTTSRIKKTTTSLSFHDCRVEVRALSRRRRPQWNSRNRRGGLGIVSELGGQYEDSFDDVKTVSRVSQSLQCDQNKTCCLEYNMHGWIGCSN